MPDKDEEEAPKVRAEEPPVTKPITLEDISEELKPDRVSKAIFKKN